MLTQIAVLLVAIAVMLTVPVWGAAFIFATVAGALIVLELIRSG